jgi:hypothetical protein
MPKPLVAAALLAALAVSSPCQLPLSRTQPALPHWSDPATWQGGGIPGPGANVHIPAGQAIVLDTLTAPLDQLRIEGALLTDSTLGVDVGITANTIEVLAGGVLQIGTASDPFRRRATITLTGPRGVHTTRAEDNGLDNDGLSRAVRVYDGGTLRLNGAVPASTRTKLDENALGGDFTLTLFDAVGWRAGDRIAISTTDFYGVGQTEMLTLASDSNGRTLQTTTFLQSARWGKLQFPLDAPIGGHAMSFWRGPFTPHRATTARQLDERADVVLLSRNIVIQGADDAAWQTQGFGVHVMVMGRTSAAQVTGVEFRRCGQRQAMGRYPFHWHMLSWTAANAQGVGGGTFLGDVLPGAHWLRNCAIWGSENRGVTVHGTCGVTVDGVAVVDCKGHAFFLEDGSEQRNTITNCIAMRARDPGAATRIKVHDSEASGFWLTNPDNTITHNSGSDCAGRGLWNTYADSPFGLSRNAAMHPSYLTVLQHEDNVGHGNREQGIATEFVVVDEHGNTGGHRYQPLTPWTMSRNVVWKNNDGGYLNRIGIGTYLDWVAADNNTRDFQGQAINSAMRGTLLICRSLNGTTPFADPRRIGVASYHYGLEITDIVAIDYPFVGPTIAANSQFVYGGGVFDQSDLYLMSLGLGSFRNSGWQLINSNPGYVTPPPYFDGFPLTTFQANKFRYWTLPGAIWDPYGYWGPAGNFLIPNHPFYTFGDANLQAVPPEGSNGWSTPTRFYGFQAVVLNNEYPQPWMGASLLALRLARLDSAGNEVGAHVVGTPSQALFFPGMRSFSIAKGGRYKLSFPDGQMPASELRVSVHNAWRGTDWYVLGMPWPGNVVAAGRYDAGFDALTQAQKLAQTKTRVFQNTGQSLADVLADPLGRVMWQDSAHNLVWVKPVGGMALNVYGFDGRSEESLERVHAIRIWPQ